MEARPITRAWTFVALVAASFCCLPLSTELAQAAEKKKAALPMLASWKGDFDGMQKRRVIRVIVPYSKTIFFIDKGNQLGIAPEWGQALEAWLNKGKKKEIERIRVAFVPTPRERLLSALNEGLGDVVAGNLTITKDRLQTVDFTLPTMTGVREVLVTGPSAPAIATVDDLAGKELFVRKTSSYREHLAALNAKFASQRLAAIMLKDADEHLEDEDLLEMVNAGLLPYVVVDDHVAQIWAKVFTALQVRTDIIISEGGEIAGAIRKKSPRLKAKLDDFITQHKTTSNPFASILRKRYYKDEKMIRRAYAPDDMRRFNELVDLFRRYGEEYGFNHLMIVAQGYQESRLNQADRSKAGAVGIMQLLPSTAREKAIAISDIETSAERNIEAGNKYLRYLITTYINQPGLDAKNQTLFAFAAYNAGPGNLRKFRARAKEMGLNPNVWFDNVENAAAAIIGRETVQYVSNIYKYFIAYQLAIHRQEEQTGARRAIAPAK